ncbi:MAG: GtrA family protein, partial [Oscillospiraceae bacterium]|nr:GtrA family protein [Oscillospiraceae bacterium]
MKCKELLIRYKKIIIYYIIGVVNTLVDFGVYSVVFFFTKMPVPSQAVGYLSGVLCSFCLNRGITFRAEKGGSPLLQFLRFMLVNLVSLAVS